MARTLQRLNSLSLSRAKKPGYFADGGGLYLQVTPAGARSWIYRFALAKRRREMGLGSFPDISLAAARQEAANSRALVKAGQDPIAVRDAERARQRLAEARGVTWDEAVDQFLGAHLGSFRNPKHRQQWRNTLDTYAKPVLGGLTVATILTPEVTKVLDPIWHKKPETASRVRGRIERILDWCKVRGYRDGENPARWRGHLDKVFPAGTKIRKVKHHAAIAIDDMPEVCAGLAAAKGMATRAVLFTILTAARAGETTGARWSEFDLQSGVWTVPADRMKMEREHRVPLSREALAIVQELFDWRTGDYVFPGGRKGCPLSIASLSKALKGVAGQAVTTHGCRSTFKDWASERTNFPRDVSEMALAHAIGDKVEEAYRRGELLEKRKALMQAWASYVTTPRQTTNVVPLARQVAA